MQLYPIIFSLSNQSFDFLGLSAVAVAFSGNGDLVTVLK